LLINHGIKRIEKNILQIRAPKLPKIVIVETSIDQSSYFRSHKRDYTLTATSNNNAN